VRSQTGVNGTYTYTSAGAMSDYGSLVVVISYRDRVALSGWERWGTQLSGTTPYISGRCYASQTYLTTMVDSADYWAYDTNMAYPRIDKAGGSYGSQVEPALSIPYAEPELNRDYIAVLTWVPRPGYELSQVEYRRTVYLAFHGSQEGSMVNSDVGFSAMGGWNPTVVVAGFGSSYRPFEWLSGKITVPPTSAFPMDAVVANSAVYAAGYSADPTLVRALHDYGATLWQFENAAGAADPAVDESNEDQPGAWGGFDLAGMGEWFGTNVTEPIDNLLVGSDGFWWPLTLFDTLFGSAGE